MRENDMDKIKIQKLGEEDLTNMGVFAWPITPSSRVRQ